MQWGLAEVTNGVLNTVHISRSVMSKVRQFNNCSLGADNKENQSFAVNQITKTVYSGDNRTTPSIVLSHESDSDTDSDGTINWKDYYGDDEQGLHQFIT